MNRSFVISIFCCLSVFLYGQDGINWVDWDSGIQRAKEENKKFIVDLYTDWCGWCKKMDATTFKDPFIVEFINEHYIPIKFNAEQKEDIEFEGIIYSFTKGGRRGYHKLAAKMTNGRLSYPSLIFFDEMNKVIQAIPGYQDARNLEMIITYFQGDFHKSTPWVTYVKNYQSNPVLSKPGIKGNSKLVGQKKN